MNLISFLLKSLSICFRCEALKNTYKSDMGNCFDIGCCGGLKFELFFSAFTLVLQRFVLNLFVILETVLHFFSSICSFFAASIGILNSTLKFK